MGDRTGIAWSRSTMSPWIGCTEVSPGCDSCYARELDVRHNWGGTGPHWGVGRPRHRTKTWGNPVKWDALAARERESGKFADPDEPWHTPGFWPVFPSLCDPFDMDVPEEWSVAFWELIERTRNLTWLLLTKRIGNVEKRSPGGDHPNVWIGASVVNQPEADRDLPKLMRLEGFGRRFVSYEPAIERVEFASFLSTGKIDQIIVGGESKQGKKEPRRFDMEWAYLTVSECRKASTPDHKVCPFVKQMGTRAYWMGLPLNLGDRAGSDPDEWGPDLNVQEFPEWRMAA